jgi:predicted ester cyclase
MSSNDDNKRFVRAYLDEVFNAHRPDRAADYLTRDVVWHGGTLGTLKGVENVVSLLRGFIGALPDLHATERDIVAEGSLVAVRLTVTATHKGELLGIAATGRPLKWDAVDVYRLADTKIAEEWVADDVLAILNQVGAYTPPWLNPRAR